MRNCLVFAAASCLAACGSAEDSAAPGAERQAVDAEPKGELAKHGAETPNRRSGQSNLKASVRNLSGDVSGLNSRMTETGLAIELPSDALFDFDSAELSSDAEELIRKALPAVRQAAPGPLRIIGHTDSKGDDTYNQDLSEQRARAVADWLGQQPGIRQREMLTEGRGEQEPVEPNTRPDGSDNPAGRARNRRVEVVLPNSR